MKQDEREQLTPQKIFNDIKEQNKDTFQKYGSILAIVGVFYFLFVLIPLSEVQLAVKVIFALTALVFIVKGYRCLRNYHCIKTGDYRIVEEPLREIMTSEPNTAATLFLAFRMIFWWLIRSHFYKRFRFLTGGTVEVEKRTAEYSAEGDIFYLVLDNKTSKILLLYHSNLYRR